MRDRTYQQARILLIVEEKRSADKLCRILKAEDYQHVDCVRDPRETVERFEHFKPDVVILDWKMCKLSGAAVLQQLRADIAPGNHLPILTLVGKPHGAMKRKALEAGATDSLNKPYNSSEIVLRVRNLLAPRFVHLQVGEQNRLVEARVEERTAELREANAALQARLRERDRAKQSVGRIREEWEQSFNAIPDHVCILNLEGKILRANRTMREQFEPLHGPLAGLDYRLCYCGTATPQTQPPCAEVLVKNRPVVWEGTLPALEGWFWIASYPLTENGVQWGAVSVVRNSTRRKQAEDALRAAHEELEQRVRDRTEELERANAALSAGSDALREGEARFRAVVEAMPSIVFIKDLEGRFLLMNKRFEELFGKPVADVVGRMNEAFLTPEEAALARADDRRVIESGRAADVEEIMPLPDGPHTFRVTKFPLCDETGRAYALCGVATDITARIQAEEKLRETDLRYSALTANAPGLVYHVVRRPDRSVAYRFVSEGSRALLGLAPSEFDNEGADPIADLVHPEDRESFLRAREESLAQATDFSWEGRVILASGETKWVNGMARVHRQPDGCTVSDGVLVEVTKQKLAEQALRESDARYRRVADKAPGMIYEYLLRTDGSMACQYVSEGSRELLGVTPAEIKADETLLMSRVHPADLQRCIDSTDESSKTLCEWNWEGRMMSVRGDEVWVRGSAHPERQPNGDTMWYGWMVDITAQKRAVEQLEWTARENTQLASAVENLTSGVVITDPSLPDHPIVFANPAFASLTGYSSQEVVGRNCRFLQGAETDPATVHAIREAIGAGRSFTGEILNYRKDGTKFWNELTITPVHDASGKLINFVGLQSDVTDRRLAERELAARGRQQAAVAKLGELGLAGAELQQLFDQAVVLVADTLHVEFSKLLEVVQRGEGCLVRAGVGWKQGVVGHTVEEAGRGSQGGYTLLADEPVVVENLATERRFKPPALLVEHGITSGVTVAIRSSTNGPFGVLGAHSRERRGFSENDIDFLQAMANVVAGAVARHAGEQRLRNAKEEADRANAAKSEFLSRMSHELRTPLNAILGFAQLAGLDADTPDDRENVEQIQVAGAHLLQLVDEILDLSSIEAGRMLLSMKPVPLRVAVNSALAVVRPLAAARNIQLADLGCNQCVLADGHRLRQVLLNLLSNAIKYNKEGGSISVTCANTANGLVRVEIKDSGDGIRAADLPRLFQPFQRFPIHGGTNQGIGLGLAISQRLVHAMGGTIGAESERGVGSTFWIELAAAEELSDDDEENAPPEVGQERSGIVNQKILLCIEDELSNVRLVERILAQRPGIRMISAPQGSIGLELALQHQPDIILLDLQLPDMHGDEVLRWLGSEPRTASIPVIMLSANAIGGEIERLKKLGARDYLTKPFDVHHLLSVLDSALAESSAPDVDGEQ